MAKPKTVTEVPRPPKRGIDWPLYAKAAFDNPGLWVEVPTPVTKAVVTRIKQGLYASIKPDGLEFTTTRTAESPDRVLVYIRAL